jgi:hypothetical protein
VSLALTACDDDQVVREQQQLRSPRHAPPLSAVTACRRCEATRIDEPWGATVSLPASVRSCAFPSAGGMARVVGAAS